MLEQHILMWIVLPICFAFRCTPLRLLTPLGCRPLTFYSLLRDFLILNLFKLINIILTLIYFLYYIQLTILLLGLLLLRRLACFNIFKHLRYHVLFYKICFIIPPWKFAFLISFSKLRSLLKFQWNSIVKCRNLFSSWGVVLFLWGSSFS